MKDAEADYSNAVTNLPEGARVEVYEKADTSTIGLKDAKVKVTLANGMSKVVTVKVMVHQPMIGLEEIPDVKTTTVYAVQGTPCDITKGVTLPEGATAEVVEDVATTEKGDFVGKVKVIFKNGMTRTVKVSVKVVKEVPWGTIEAIPAVTPVPHNYTIGDITLEDFAKLDDHEFFKTDVDVCGGDGGTIRECFPRACVVLRADEGDGEGAVAARVLRCAADGVAQRVNRLRGAVLREEGEPVVVEGGGIVGGDFQIDFIGAAGFLDVSCARMGECDAEVGLGALRIALVCGLEVIKRLCVGAAMQVDKSTIDIIIDVARLHDVCVRGTQRCV